MDSQFPATAVIGMPWCACADFDRIREIMADRDRLHLTYDEWKKAAEKGEREMRAAGRRVVRAHLDPEDFITWCAARDMELNAGARNKFAAEVAYLEITGKS